MRKKLFTIWKTQIAIVILLVTTSFGLRAQTFTHPCIGLSANDLALVKSHIQAGEQPWKAGYDGLAADWRASLSYTMQGPFATVQRNPNLNLTQWRNDMTAAWYLALMWYFTGNEQYATKSRDILIAWANTQTVFGGTEAHLDLGDYAHAFGGAASILRGSWSGWTADNTTAVKSLFNNVYWSASGCAGNTLGPANKGALSMATGAAVAAFSDDTAKVNKVLTFLRTSASSGFLNTLPIGEVGESARDQGHAYGQWLSLTFAAEVMWKLGIDVYSYLDNRLAAVGEYFARKNLGASLPYIPFGTTDYLYNTDGTAIWNGGHRGAFILNGAYVVRKGMQLPYLKKYRDNVLTSSQDFMFCKSADNSTATAPTAISFPTASLTGTGLTNADIGGATPAGTGTFSNNVWTVTGGGTEIWTHSAESFHFVYKQISGDCSIIAKVNSVSTVASTSKAGVMIASDLTSNPSQRAWIAVTAAQTAEAYMHGWTDVYGGSNWEKFSRPLIQSSYWIKIERLGDKIALYTSLDGTSWAVETEGRFSGFTGTAYIGLAVCALSNTTACTGTFSNVSITGGTGGVVTTPDAPSACMVSAGDAQATLRWSHSFGATSYTIKRAVSINGVIGSYTTIASGLTSPYYVNTGLVNNQLYYYKVCAVNSAGTSADSPVDSSTTKATTIATLNGMYKVIAKHSGKAIDVNGGSLADGASVIQYTYGGSSNQLWKFTQLSGNTYKVENVRSGKALDVVNNSTAGGALIEQRTYSSSDTSQQWTLYYNWNDSTYSLINKASGKALDIAGGSTADGASADIWDYNWGNNQRFRIVRVDTLILGGTYKILAQHSSKSLDVNGGSTADGALIIQWPYSGATNQQWDITQISGNNYNVLSNKSGKSLTLVNNGVADGTLLEQRTYTGAANQIWNITRNSDGSYKFVNTASGSVLDVAGASTADGASLDIWTDTGATNQKFLLTLLSSQLKSASITTSVEEQRAGSVRMYPNPVIDILNVETPQSSRLMLYNELGVLVRSQSLVGGFNQLDMASFMPGVYFVRLDDGHSVTTRCVVKK